MKISPPDVICPRCLSWYVTSSQPRSGWEYLPILINRKPHICRNCGWRGMASAGHRVFLTFLAVAAMTAVVLLVIQALQ